VQIGIYPGFQDGNAAKLFKLGGMCVIIKGAGYKNVETRVGRFFGSTDQIGAGYGAKLRADKDRRPLLGLIFVYINTLCTDQVARPGC